MQHLLRLLNNFYIFRFRFNMFCVCLATFTISAIVVVHCLDNCCLLFKKCAHEGGCQGAPGLNHRQPSLVVSPFGGTFFTHNFVHYHLLQKLRSSSKHVPKMVFKSTKNVFPNRYTFLLCFFVVSRGAQKSEHVFGLCLCSPNHFGHRSHGTRNGWKNHQKRYTNTPRKHD